MFRQNILWIVLAVIALGASAYWLSGRHGNTNKGEELMATTTIATSSNAVSVNREMPTQASPTQTTGTKTYTDTKHDYRFTYPTDTEVQTSSYGSIHPFNSDPVAFIWEGREETQTEGYFTVNISSDPVDVGNCSIFSTKQDNVTFKNSYQTTMNGITYMVFNTSNGGGDLIRDYKTLHNGACYDLEVSAFASACILSGCEDRRWSPATFEEIFNRLELSAQSFSFTS